MPLLDLEPLLLPIAGDDPAGPPVSFLVRTQLEEARKETEADASDPAVSPRRIDWAGLVRLTEDLLATKSKDLLVAARLTEALTRQHGFPGLTEGLTLLRRLIDEAWDRVHPAIEDGDLEVRAAPFNWLGEPDRGARFPVTVRSLPLGANAPFSWLDWKRRQEGRNDAVSEAYDQAIEQTSREEAFRATQAILSAVEAFSALLAKLNEQLGDAAPSMEGLQMALGDCLGLAQHVLLLKGGPPRDDEPGDGPRAASGEDSQASCGEARAASAGDYRRAAMARSDVYRRLAEAGEELRILEPHSPVPFLIRKAVAWGNLSFPELMRTMSQQEGLMSLLSRDEENAEGAMVQDS
jgi:type VI secretion system protein ImpA